MPGSNKKAGQRVAGGLLGMMPPNEDGGRRGVTREPLNKYSVECVTGKIRMAGVTKAATRPAKPRNAIPGT